MVYAMLERDDFYDKKLGVLIATVVFLLTGCTQEDKPNTHNVYELTITANLLSNKSVGDDRSKRYTCDGESVPKKTQFLVPIGTTETVEITATVVEQDKYPDVGEGVLSVTLNDGFEASTTITVKENKGRYKGNTAQWKIICTVTLVDQIRQ